MSTLFRTLFTCLLSVLSLSLLHADNDLRQQKDSLLKIVAKAEGKAKLDAYKSISNWLFYKQAQEVDTLIYYLDIYQKEARKQESIMDEGWARATALSALLNAAHYDGIFKRIDEDLLFFAKNEFWATYYTNYRRLINAYSRNGQKEKALQKNQEMYEYAKKNNHTIGISNALLQMGELYLRTERLDEAKKCFEECLATERQSDKISKMRITVYFHVANSYVALNEFDKAQVLLKEWENDLKKYEAETGNKEIAYWVDLYGIYLQLYANKEEWNKIEPYCQLIEGMTMNVGLKKSIANYRARALMAKKEYQKAFEQAEISHAASLELGDLHSITQSLKLKATLFSYLENHDSAKQSIDSLLLTKDSLFNIESNKQLNELRTVYEVDKLTAEKAIIRQRWIIAVAISLLLLALLAINMVYSRRLHQKNKTLFLQIQELTQKEKAVEQCLRSRPEETLSQEMVLFRRASDYLLADKLFTDPELNRRKLADLIGSNETYLADAIREATGETFSAYISTLRLQYALELFETQPDISLDSVAVDTGYGSYSPFYRAFIKKYGITPSEYRKLAKVKP